MPFFFFVVVHPIPLYFSTSQTKHLAFPVVILNRNQNNTCGFFLKTSTIGPICDAPHGTPSPEIFLRPTPICIHVIFFELEIDLWCSLWGLKICIICHYSWIAHYPTSWATFLTTEAVRRGLNSKHKKSYETSLLLLTCYTRAYAYLLCPAVAYI